MKKSRLLLSIGLLAFAGLSTTLTSCGEDDEVCPVGYEGKDCKELSRTKFMGSWNGKDICDSGTYDDITLTVSPSSESEIKAIVANPGGFGGSITIVGEMTSSTTVKFTNQSVGSGRTLNGTMSISGTDALTFTYDVEGSVDEDGCIGSYTKM